MNVDESAIGVWPNVAILAGTDPNEAMRQRRPVQTLTERARMTPGAAAAWRKASAQWCAETGMCKRDLLGTILAEWTVAHG